MILVTVTRKAEESHIQSIKITGHAESGPYGYDLVCAGVSAVSIGTVNAVMKLSEINLSVEQGSDGGYLKIDLPKRAQENDMKKAQLLLEGMLVSLKSIELEYGQFIKIKEK